MSERWTEAAVLGRLRSLAGPGGREGMARYGINPALALGVRIPDLRRLAHEIGTDHSLALRLWRTGVHEARILAGMIDDPARVTERQMESWARGFDSWDLCDQVCANLFDRTPHAWEKAVTWTARHEEFVKRAGFTLMACLAVHARSAGDTAFRRFLRVIEERATDERNYVRKGASWALRQIGKRNDALHAAAVRVARSLAQEDTPGSRWVGRDVLRELEGRG